MNKLITALILFLFCSTLTFSQQVEREYVAVEFSTGTECYYCPGAEVGALDMLANGDDVAVIMNHLYDSFVNIYSTARLNYYGISAYPIAKFDGVLQYVGGLPCPDPTGRFANYHPLYETRKAIMSSFTMDLVVSEGVASYDAVITINQVETAVTDNCVVHLFVTESNIAHSWFGCMTEVNYVNRLMVPDEMGTPLNLDGTQQIINLNFAVDPTWDLANCEVVAFIQYDVTKEIYQTTKVPMSAGAPVDLVIDGDVITTGGDLCFFASNSIEVPAIPGSYVIESGAMVDFIAGSVITLNPGFHAEPGSYMHAYINASGCTPPPAVITGIKEDNNMKNLSLSLTPNPANDVVYIGFDENVFQGNVTIQLYDIVGERKIEKEIYIMDQYELNISDIPPGLYLVNVITDDHTFTGKLIKATSY